MSPDNSDKAAFSLRLFLLRCSPLAENTNKTISQQARIQLLNSTQIRTSRPFIEASLLCHARAAAVGAKKALHLLLLQLVTSVVVSVMLRMKGDVSKFQFRCFSSFLRISVG